MLLFGVVSYKVRPPRLVSYACLYTTKVIRVKIAISKLEKKIVIPFTYFELIEQHRRGNSWLVRYQRSVR